MIFQFRLTMDDEDLEREITRIPKKRRSKVFRSALRMYLLSERIPAASPAIQKPMILDLSQEDLEAGGGVDVDQKVDSLLSF